MEPKSGHAPAERRAPDVAEKLDRAESELHTVERRLGEELYDNIARSDEAFRAGFAERDAVLDRTKERIATTARRMRKGKAIADPGRSREAVAEKPKGDADAASQDSEAGPGSPAPSSHRGTGPRTSSRSRA